MLFGVQVNVYRTSWDSVRGSVLAMEAGVAEIMFGGIPSGDVAMLQRFESEVVAALR